MSNISYILRNLSLNGSYLGFRYTEVAYALVCEKEEYLYSMKDLYAAVAKRFPDTSADAVETDISTVVEVAWTNYPDTIREMAGYPLLRTPSVADFLAILFNYTMRHFPHCPPARSSGSTPVPITGQD